MKIIDTTFERLPRERLEIGFEGENQRATVRIDCASVFAEYPNATPTLIVKPLFADAYPVVVDRNGTDVDWLITSEILSFTGDGEIQLVFYKDQVICKSAVSKIRVSRSLTVTGEMPDPVVQWIDDANRKLAEVDAQITELEGMVDTATDAATRAEQSASTASTKAEQAAGSAATATEKATEATNAAGTATAKAAEAQTAAQTATAKATAAAESERIATAKAVEATTAAGTATAKAEQATEAAQTATEKARDASASARAAHASATDAASSATAASASETAAKASETAASTSATQAAQSAQTANTAAQTATQKAAEASQSASNAAASATNAVTSAETASTKAGEAAQSAQAVEETAEQLAESLAQIDQNTQDIAELDERKANIDGYYPDMTVGNAEQLNSSKFVENSEPYTLRTSGGTSDIGNREYLDAVVGGTVAWNQRVRDEASENETDYADIVTVDDAVEDAAGVKVKIEPVQDLHGYDHPWPAGGGKNKFETTAESKTESGVTWTVNEDGSVSVSGTAENYTAMVLGTARVDSHWGTVTISGISTATNIVWGRIALKDDNDADVYLVTGGSTNPTISVDLSQYPTATKVYVVIKRNNNDAVSGIVKPMVEIGSTATDWTPYSNICPITGWDGVQIVVSPTTDAEDGQTYDITLPTEAGTVYGGELTVNEDGTGTLVVELAKRVINGNERFWAYASNETYAHMVFETPDSMKEQNQIMCDKLRLSGGKPYTNSGEGVWQGGSYTWYVCVKKDLLESDDSAGFSQWLTNNNLTCIYKLATPQTYTLTASEIRTLLGQNNVWADTGDLALTYTGTDEHLTLESGKKYLSRISGTDSMLLGSGQEITAAKGTDNVFDLTQMFGTAVADYVYGQGASFFRRWFPNARYPYNAGELQSVEGLSAHEMVGFNLFDKTKAVMGKRINGSGNETTVSGYSHSDYIPVIPNAQYYTNASSGADGYPIVAVYDALKNFVICLPKYVPGTFTTPENSAYVILSTKDTATHIDALVLNLSHNGSRNGEYEPYEKHSYPLDSSVILRGIPKVGANGVYWDGDRYLPDGTVERRYGVVDLGTLEWAKYGSTFYANVAGLKPTGSTLAMGNIMCPKYTNVPVYQVTGTYPYDKIIAANEAQGRVNARDSLYAESTASEFRDSLSGVYLVYELATPTTETAQPYHSTQWVSDWGTEEFVSTGLVPVGHETRYPANLRDKLQHLPDAASGNGSYLITQTDGQMVLTPFPAPPSTAGNYVLKATVTGGVATYTWEVAT